MKQARLVLTALAVLMAGSAAIAVACDKSKQVKASAASVTADASTCSHASDAAGKSAKATAVVAMSGACPSSASCPHMSAAECKAHMSAGGCKAKTSASAASTGGMCGKSTSAAAVAASASGTGNHATKSASAKSGCGEKASAASVGTCSGHGMATTAARSSHGDCDACEDMAGCEQEIESAKASTQVVPLKNGVMFVYTADTPASVHAVQAAMARRNDRMVQFASAGDKARLCSGCKEMRGAAASGKMSREVVNIEGGCLTLVTSNDPSVVAKLHAMAGITTASRVKS
jgi:hypothetical protein